MGTIIVFLFLIGLFVAAVVVGGIIVAIAANDAKKDQNNPTQNR